MALDNVAALPAPAQTPDIVPLNPSDLMTTALSNGANVDVIARLMELSERHEANCARRAFNRALAAAKAEMPIIRKNRHVDFKNKDGSRTSYQHEDLAEIVASITDILAKHDLGFRWTTANDERSVAVTCQIYHDDGHSIETTLSAGADASGKKNHIQSVGSAVTYLQRYTLKAILGLAASHDDDGRSSSTPVSAAQSAPPPKLTDEQFVELCQLMEANGVEVPDLLRVGQLNSLDEITQNRLERLRAWVIKKGKERGDAK